MQHKDSLEDAMEMAVECLAGYLHTCQAEGDTIPEPSKLTDIDAAAVSEQVSPHEPIGECFINMVSVDVAAYAKEHFDKSVRKTLTIPAWLNTAAPKQDINFSKTLQEALINKLSISRTR